MWDILIQNGKLVDGLGSPWYYGDIAIVETQIAAIGNISGAAKLVIDAKGLVVSPGFIDAHSHSDDSLIENGQAESKIRQGVTSEVIGQCGSSAAPRTADDSSDYRPELATFASYLALLEQQGVSLNVIPLFGHGNLRKVVMGYDNRVATEDELAQMCQIAADCMQAGAYGFTTGLIYPPGSFADENEIVKIAEVVASYGGLYATHLRDEGHDLLEAVAEAIRIGEQARLPVHISHHKACGEENWGLVKESLKYIDDKRA
ncbi:MAG: amidohydrolase family protein, partial [bacterium]|nr:amidohydrolase family protein [bacterium]